MSLKDSLLQLLKSRGQLSYSEMVNVCLEDGMKISNGERRMRELCNEEPIAPVMKKSKRGGEYIGGWEMKPNRWELKGNKIVFDYPPQKDESITIGTHTIQIFAPRKETKNNLPIKGGLGI